MKTSQLGGKAAALHILTQAGFPVPPWQFVGPEEAVPSHFSLNGTLFAVRSSAVGEDSAAFSFAGQFDSFLFVPNSNLAEKIDAVRASGKSERVLEYRATNVITGPPPVPGAIVQEMIDAVAAGVAFSADPVGGRRNVALVSGVWGLGSALVSGEADADSFAVSRTGEMLTKSIVSKPKAHAACPTAVEGVVWVDVPHEMQGVSCLTDAQVSSIAALARRCESQFGQPQDIEWAIDAAGVLWLLQSRPITSLSSVPDPDDDLCLWDNSNISESYSGVTTPLTYTFAKRIYEHAYRGLCRLLSVPTDRVATGTQVFPNMLGLVRGRIYYNLLNWYRVLAMLPGFQLNRVYMEQMMGVKEPLPEELVKRVLSELPKSGRLREWWNVLRMLAALVAKHRGLPRQTKEFQALLDETLAPPPVPLNAMRLEELTNHYNALEGKLLHRWDAPMVNDFFAMIFFGLLRGLCTKWCGDTQGNLANTLVRNNGPIISMEPLTRIAELAALVRGRGDLLACLHSATSVHAFAMWPDFQASLDSYIEKFGDRCLEELKLESATLKDSPEVLYRSIAAVASRPETPPISPSTEPPPRFKNPAKRWFFQWVLSHAKRLVQQRENLRFERTRLFGRVRNTLVEIGKRLKADGILDCPRDVFFLELSEVLSLSSPESLRSLAAARKAVFQAYGEQNAPPDRLATRGPLHRHHHFTTTAKTEEIVGDTQKGLGCCAGMVRGRVRVVMQPKQATLEPGEILVARHTDPGWVMLFPLASGLLVERGSLLSHSAIVAREMGLPAVVGLPGLCEWLQTGDWVELDGATGIVKKIAPTNEP